MLLVMCSITLVRVISVCTLSAILKSLQHADLLSCIISSCPHVALDAPPQLKEVFTYLSLLPPPSAIELLHTVLVF